MQTNIHRAESCGEKHVGNMETIIINTNQFRETERYAKLHNVTVKQLVEQYLKSFHPKKALREADDAMLARLEALGGEFIGNLR